MKRNRTDEFDSLINVTRGFLGYLCLIILFGGVILIVQSSMEVKRIRYSLTISYKEKKELLVQLSKLDNRIGELEQYSRIAERIETSLPHLGPPRRPAIELKVDGLMGRSGILDAPHVLLQDESPLANMRKGWHNFRQSTDKWLRGLVK